MTNELKTLKDLTEKHIPENKSCSGEGKGNPKERVQ